MQQILQQGHSLDPGQPLRNEVLYMKPKSREEESWKKFHHKHKQVFGQMFQLQEKEVKEAGFTVYVGRCFLYLQRSFGFYYPHCTLLEISAPLLRREMTFAAQLVSAVKQGSSYFQLLKEQEEKKNEKRRKKEERRLAGLHHPSSTFVSENAEDSSLNSQASTVFSQEKAAMLAEMQLMFKERTRELSLNLTETLDLKAKKIGTSLLSIIFYNKECTTFRLMCFGFTETCERRPSFQHQHNVQSQCDRSYPILISCT
ncbi:hypothetical protein C0J45_21663 [Silurus meridionalis]|nr:hypothetical protein C0J45_21663 [Silurus meridionalis]